MCTHQNNVKEMYTLRRCRALLGECRALLAKCRALFWCVRLCFDVHTSKQSLTHQNNVLHIYSRHPKRARTLCVSAFTVKRALHFAKRAVHSPKRALHFPEVHHKWEHAHYVSRHSHVWHDSFVRSTVHIRTCNLTWGAGVETQKYVREEIGGWGRVQFNEPYAPLLNTIYDGA